MTTTSKWIMASMRLLAASFFALLWSCTSSQGQTASFSLQVKDEIMPYTFTSLFVLPNETVTLDAVFDGPLADYEAHAVKGKVTSLTGKSWQYTAPTRLGEVDIMTIVNEHADDSIMVNCFVMVPFSRMDGTKLNGYDIGEYPASTKAIYAKPLGFVEITEDNKNTMVSPHFLLGDFKCKQVGGHPKYALLNQRLLLKLELIIEQLNLAGYKCTGLKVLSGYRTPQYNKEIGNVQFSRHVFGDAADIYIDEDGDGQMDDLNGDGKSDKEDARVLFQLIEGLREQSWYKPYIGGLGLYARNSRHSAFVHVDTRGYVSRWGHE